MPVKITRSIIRVAEDGLKFVGTPLPTDVEERIRLTYEMRALRPWEDFREGIIRWSLFVNVGAAVGNFSGVRIQLAAISNAVPRGTVFSVDEIANHAAGVALDCFIGSSPAGLISSAPADFTDARWSARTGIPPLNPVTGSSGAITGDQINRIAGAATKQAPGLFIGAASDLGTDDNQTLTIFGSAVNTAILITIQGRIVVPR